MSDAVETTEDGKVKKSRRFDERDWKMVAEFIKSEFDKRQTNRKDREKAWREIDRQIAMIPDIRFKQDMQGNVSKSKAWMPEMELPDQAQALEVLTADSRRLMFPDSGTWFAAHSLITDDYLEKIDFSAILSGDENDVPTKINQDNVDKLVEAWLGHQHQQYDFKGEWDKLHAEAFKYGTFVGRARVVKESIFRDTAVGIVRKNRKTPVLFAQSIKNTYLDENPHNLMREGIMVGPANISYWYQSLADLTLAANKGSNDPNDEDGGWMPANIKGLIPDKSGNVQIIEWDGDLVVPRKTTRSVFVPNVNVRIAVGGDVRVIRFRFNKFPFSTFISQPYHIEGADCNYGVGPLEKGLPIQMAATEALNRLSQWAILNTEPPLQYSKDDPFFAVTGGPEVMPRALWASTGPVSPVDIGDGGGLLNLYLSLRQQYADLTGVTAPRLGAQTVSHTTAYSKEVEIQRGTARTVDYVKSVLTNSAVKWLNMEFEMAKTTSTGEEDIYIPSYGGWVKFRKEMIPEKVVFEAYGAGAPQEQRDKESRRLASLQLAMQIDAIKVQNGLGKPLNYEALQREILGQGGWTDLDVILNAPASSGVSGGVASQPAIPGAASGLPATVDTALARII